MAPSDVAALVYNKQQSLYFAQLAQLEAVLDTGVRDDVVWEELLGLWSERRKTIDTDSRVQFRQRIALSQEQAAALAALVIQGAFEFIPDEENRAKFADRIEANSPGGVSALTRAGYGCRPRMA